MRILITGICGFAGSVLALELKRQTERVEIHGIDNLSRPGSEQNRRAFKQHGITFVHGDIRSPSDLADLPEVDWVIDAAANPSVLAGLSGEAGSRQLMEHNLVSTIHVLEYCKRHKAGLVMLSTSRVYSLERLAALPLEIEDDAFVPRPGDTSEPGFSEHGVAENFSTQPPLSLYGTAKLASEALALEYGYAFDLPVFVNRCGVLAGAGQFGKADQGIFSFWVHSYRHKRALNYIGFGGAGVQVRDCLHPRDLASLVATQIRHPEKGGGVLNIGGGRRNNLSLAQLSRWCATRFGPHQVKAETSARPYDVPWLVLDCRRAETEWNWRPTITLEGILAEIADHAEQHPEWLELSGAS
jgi:CDP-paratose 2-epimerase